MVVCLHEQRGSGLLNRDRAVRDQIKQSFTLTTYKVPVKALPTVDWGGRMHSQHKRQDEDAPYDGFLSRALAAYRAGSLQH